VPTAAPSRLAAASGEAGGVGAVLRAFLPGYLAEHPGVSAAERRILQKLADCRTGALGYTLYHCDSCGQPQRVPKACGDRHCPACQGRLAHRWLERQQAALLPVPYYHAVFTLPHALLPLCAARPAVLYRLLLPSAAETLLRFGHERLGGELGVTAVLHTWGQPLNYHPHAHCLVTGGALTADGRWCAPKQRGFLFDVRALGAVFRGKFLAGLNALKERGAVPAPPAGWPALWRALGRARWVVFAKRPFGGPTQVLAYLSHYTHRVAISDRRILKVDVEARTVTFAWRDYRDGGKVQRGTLGADKFIDRFRRHLLPRGFSKIRHFGLLANHRRATRLAQARAALIPDPVPPPPAQAAPATGAASPAPGEPPVSANPSTRSAELEPPCPHCAAPLRLLGVVTAEGHFRPLCRRRAAATGPTQARAPP
jgi:hypothetical protein